MIRVSRSVIGAEERHAVDAVLQKAFLGMGPEVKAFENELEQYLGGESRVICVSTGTAAIQLAIQAAGIGPGDEVLVPTLTFVATFQAISATGAIPVPCDVSPDTGLLDLNDAERRITSRTRAVVPVFFASQLGDPEENLRFGKIHHLRVIEDAAHAFGCRVGDKRIGSFGDITCFSFDGIKNITSGEGGAVASRCAEVIEAVSDARLLGVKGDSAKRYRHERSWDFDVTSQGWRYHMSDLMAAIGRVQLKRLEGEFAPKRMTLESLYRSHLAACESIRFLGKQQEGIVPFMMVIRVLNNKRDALRAHLLQEGIEVGIHYKPSHLLTKFGNGSSRLPMAEKLYTQILTLPLHPALLEQDVERISKTIIQYLEK